jgi:methionyl-tRNA synthetase
MDKKSLYITTPIYYVNAAPHIGTAYTTLVCDVIARFKRLEGYEVKFLTGTDEHGQKIEKTADKFDLSPQEFADTIATKFKALFKQMKISNDDFIRTTEERHKRGAVALWNKLKENGHIYLDKYSGWYAIRDEAFYAEGELVDGKAPTGAEVEWISEESYFFDLSKWQGKLLEFYEKNPNFVEPKWRFNEIKSFVKAGLRDLSISRTSFKWGVPIPGDENHVMYVWLDALSNYIAALGYPNSNSKDFNKFWPADIHMVGKDITRFHAIYWPAFLMAADIELPKQIVSHGWWLNEGEKISKSLGNVIDPVDLINQYGLDQVRYYLMREISFGNDGNFTNESFINRVNSELSNKLGNLVQRSLSMIYKSCDQQIPAFSNEKIKVLYNEIQILEEASHLFCKIKKYFDQYEFNKVLECVFEFVDSINAYINEQAPWELSKSNPGKMQDVLYAVLEATRHVLIILIPFVPDSAHQLLEQLKIVSAHRSFNCLNRNFALKYKGKITKPISVFPRIE